MITGTIIVPDLCIIRTIYMEAEKLGSKMCLIVCRAIGISELCTLPGAKSIWGVSRSRFNFKIHQKSGQFEKPSINRHTDKLCDVVPFI